MHQGSFLWLPVLGNGSALPGIAAGLLGGAYLGGQQDVAQVRPGAEGAATLAQPAQLNGLIQAAQVAVLQAAQAQKCA
jgi:hypothetical protein